MKLFHFLGFKGKHHAKPLVIVDFELIDDTFYLSIINASPKPAYDVCVFFDSPIMGHHATRNIANLPTVKKIPFLPPFKQIQLFIDPIEVFFHHNFEEQYDSETHYKDHKGCQYKDRNIHKMDLYKNLPNKSHIKFLMETS